MFCFASRLSFLDIFEALEHPNLASVSAGVLFVDAETHHHTPAPFNLMWSRDDHLCTRSAPRKPISFALVLWHMHAVKDSECTQNRQIFACGRTRACICAVAHARMRTLTHTHVSRAHGTVAPPTTTLESSCLLGGCFPMYAAHTLMSFMFF